MEKTEKSKMSYAADRAWVTLIEINKKLHPEIKKAKLVGKPLNLYNNRFVKEPWYYPDYVYIQNNQLFFIEHKRKGDKLSSLQNDQFKKLLEHKDKIYLVFYKKIPSKKKNPEFEILDATNCKKGQKFISLTLGNIDKYSKSKIKFK